MYFHYVVPSENRRAMNCTDCSDLVENGIPFISIHVGLEYLRPILGEFTFQASPKSHSFKENRKPYCCQIYSSLNLVSKNLGSNLYLHRIDAKLAEK